MSYKIRETDSINIRERYLYHTRKYPPKGTPRKKRENPTSESMKNLNIAHAVDKLFFELCANFTSDDLYLTLKYDGTVNKSISAEQMKEDKSRFIRLLRDYYRKRGKELKFVYTYGISANGVRHMHMVVNTTGENAKYIRELWKKAVEHAGRATYENLWENFDYRGLAEYFIKNGKEAIAFDSKRFTRLYNPSRNLIKPVVKKRTVKRSSTFQQMPKVDEGYELLENSIRSGYDFYGYKYLKYLMIKKE